MSDATTTDEAALLAAILANPDCDTVRLAYADWLDEQATAENGYRECAEFIRVQCRHPDIPQNVWRCPCGCRRLASDASDPFVLPWLKAALEPLPHCIRDRKTVVRLTRGFVDSVACTLADWLAFGKAIVRRHPVKVVGLSDRVPVAWPFGERVEYVFISETSGWVKHAQNRDAFLPHDLAILVKRDCATRDAALDALSDACLAWAKGQEVTT